MSREILLSVKDIKKWFPVDDRLFGKPTSYVKAVDGVSFDDTGCKNNKYKVETCWRFCVFVSKLILHFVHNDSCLGIKLGSAFCLIVYFY